MKTEVKITRRRTFLNVDNEKLNKQTYELSLLLLVLAIILLLLGSFDKMAIILCYSVIGIIFCINLAKYVYSKSNLVPDYEYKITTYEDYIVIKAEDESIKKTVIITIFRKGMKIERDEDIKNLIFVSDRTSTISMYAKPDMYQYLEALVIKSLEE